LTEVKKKKFPIVDYIALVIGSAIMALGISVFLIDAQVVPGGVSGLSIAIYYLTGSKVSVGLMMWVFNVPLFLWGLKELGRSFAFRTFFSFSLNSLFIDLFRGDIPGLTFIKLQNMQTVKYLFNHDFMFLILLGSIFLGVGLGVIFKFKGTTAGSDIVAAILNKRYGIKPGQAIMMTDFFVIALAGIVIEMTGISQEKSALTLTLYAILSLFISSKIIDFILDGFDYARMAFIISEKSSEISDMVLDDLNRGATGFKTRGLYSNSDREVIMTVVPTKQVGALTEKVKEIDPHAFIIIGNVHEVLGRGFRSRI
jgi:uncharacterized membrane-anchored protein YitT (DUF2179 family)